MIFPVKADSVHTISMHFGVGTAFAIAAVVAGCNQPIPHGSFSVVTPETIQVDGGEWTRVEWSKQIDTKVANHFRRAPQLADNPSLSGDAVCYSNASKQRVYWLSPVDDTCQWAMVEFKGSRGGELVEGSGAPFLEVLAVDQ